MRTITKTVWISNQTFFIVSSFPQKLPLTQSRHFESLVPFFYCFGTQFNIFSLYTVLLLFIDSNRPQKRAFIIIYWRRVLWRKQLFLSRWIFKYTRGGTNTKKKTVQLTSTSFLKVIRFFVTFDKRERNYETLESAPALWKRVHTELI